MKLLRVILLNILLSAFATSCMFVKDISTNNNSGQQKVYVGWAVSGQTPDAHAIPQSINGIDVKDIIKGVYVNAGAVDLVYNCSAGLVRNSNGPGGLAYSIVRDAKQISFDVKPGHMYFVEGKALSQANVIVVPVQYVSTIDRRSDGRLYRNFEPVYEERVVNTPVDCAIRVYDCEGYVYFRSSGNRNVIGTNDKVCASEQKSFLSTTILNTKDSGYLPAF